MSARVVVALDCAEHTERTVREAARVAARIGAELEALLVEDEALLALAAHPFARRIGAGGEARSFDAPDLEREWRDVEKQARAALEREAGRGDVPVRLVVERGRSERAIRARLERGDLVVVGWGGWSPRARRAAPIRVLYDGGEAAEHALEVGVRLAGPTGQLAVWWVGTTEGVLEAARARLAGRVGSLRLAPIDDPSVRVIRHVLAARPGGLLVVPADSEVAEALAARSVEARFAAGVLVVR